MKAELTQKADTVTGKIGRAQDEQLETHSRRQTHRQDLTFDVMPEEATTPMKFTLTLVSDDRIEGDMAGAIDVGKIIGEGRADEDEMNRATNERE